MCWPSWSWLVVRSWSWLECKASKVVRGACLSKVMLGAWFENETHRVEIETDLVFAPAKGVQFEKVGAESDA